jgi:transmembrane sensor
MEQEFIWELIAKKLSGEASKEELCLLESILRNNPDLHYSMQSLIGIWGVGQQIDKQEAQHAFKRHLERMENLEIDLVPQPDLDPTLENINPPKRKTFSFKPYLVFGTILIASFLLFKWYSNPASTIATAITPRKNRDTVVREVSTNNGYKTNLILPDGTKVWLNAGSKLTYDSSYGLNLREVVLSGEAFFDVVKNKEKPFIIHTAKINIKVLGTEFNVRSYPTDKTTEASLIRGSIEVTFKDKPNKKVILKPNEKIVVENEELIKRDIPSRDSQIEELPIASVKGLTHANKTGEIIETSWVENKLIFQDQSFEDIAQQLERWYGVTINFENQHLKENHLTGSFKNETIRQALDALKFTASFKYNIDNNNNVTIY